MCGDVVGGGLGIPCDPLSCADEIALHGLGPVRFAGFAGVGGLVGDAFEIPGTGEIAVMLGPLELLEAEGLGGAAIGTGDVVAVLATGEEVLPDRGGLDGGGGGEADLGDLAVEIRPSDGELEGGGFEGGIVWPLVDLIGEEITNRAGGEVAFGTGTDELEGACGKVHLRFSEVIFVGGYEVLDGRTGSEAGMELALGPAFCILVGRGDVEDRAGVFGDGPHEAISQPGGAADLGGLHKSELADAGIGKPKVELPKVGSVIGVVFPRARGEALVEGDVILRPLESGWTAARVPDASELLADIGLKRWHRRGGSLWPSASRR